MLLMVFLWLKLFSISGTEFLSNLNTLCMIVCLGYTRDKRQGTQSTWHSPTQAWRLCSQKSTSPKCVLLQKACVVKTHVVLAMVVMEFLHMSTLIERTQQWHAYMVYTMVETKLERQTSLVGRSRTRPSAVLHVLTGAPWVFSYIWTCIIKVWHAYARCLVHTRYQSP